MSFTKEQITTYLFRCHCERCNHEWESVGQEPPRVCAACKSSGWNRPEEGRRTLAQRIGAPMIVPAKPTKGAKK
jgi:hypothetical protein